MLTLLICFLCIINFLTSYQLVYHSKRSKYFALNNNNSKNVNLQRELDLFFEKVAENGSTFVRTLTVEERAKRAILGSELEDEIFDLRDKIVDMENGLMRGESDASIEKIKEMRSKFANLKQSYIEIVGGGDLPIYFGKNTPDSLQ